MILGVGIDVVDIERFSESLERTPALLDRLFTSAESGLPVGSLAGRFAAKEALAKALGAPAGLAWLDAEIVNEEWGRPVLRLSGTVDKRAQDLGVRSSHLSISHDGGIASAIVVLEG